MGVREEEREILILKQECNFSAQGFNHTLFLSLYTEIYKTMKLKLAFITYNNILKQVPISAEERYRI